MRGGPLNQNDRPSTNTMREQHLLVAMAAALLSLWPLGTVVAQVSPGTAIETRRTCVPPFWGGVLAGSTRVEAVARLFGRGVTTKVRGEDVRFYTDRAKSRTVMIRFSDNVVTSLDVWEGLAVPGLPNAGDTRSDWLRPTEGLGVWAGVNIGASGSSVRENMGEPARVLTEDGFSVWVYESSCACELSTGLVFRFRADRLVSFGIWAAAG